MRTYEFCYVDGWDQWALVQQTEEARQRKQERRVIEANHSHSNGCQHEWVVFSTALEDRCLMLNCVKCAMHASVDDPTKEEWSKAFHAPSRPYRWTDESRVTIRSPGSHRIQTNGSNQTACEQDRSISGKRAAHVSGGSFHDL